MESQEALELARQTIYLFLFTSMPVLLVALGVGLVISLLQALTQIQESTLSFVPKLVTIFFTLYWCLPFIGRSLSDFCEMISQRIIG